MLVLIWVLFLVLVVYQNMLFQVSELVCSNLNQILIFHSEWTEKIFRPSQWTLRLLPEAEIFGCVSYFIECELIGLKRNRPSHDYDDVSVFFDPFLV